MNRKAGDIMMIDRWIRKRGLMAAAGIALYFALSLPLARRASSFIHDLLVWNMFLAVVPLGFALLLHKSRRPWLTALCGFCWLLFFPNAPYLVTDLMHIVYLQFHSSVSGSLDMNLQPWFTLMHLAIGVFMGTVVGMFSLRIVHLRVAAWLGRAAGWVTVSIVSLLSGYALFIGRYLRFNSWDILHPATLLAGLQARTNWFSLSLTLLFAAFVLCAYAVYYAFSSPD